jgi:hypothetical protein
MSRLMSRDMSRLLRPALLSAPSNPTEVTDPALRNHAPVTVSGSGVSPTRWNDVGDLLASRQCVATRVSIYSRGWA